MLERGCRCFDPGRVFRFVAAFRTTGVLAPRKPPTKRVEGESHLQASDEEHILRLINPPRLGGVPAGDDGKALRPFFSERVLPDTGKADEEFPSA